MLFLTNRTMKSRNNRKSLPRPVRFDLDDNTAGQGLSFCERADAEEYTEIGSEDFLDKLRDSHKQQVLLYIHGFNNLPESDIFPRASRLQALFNQESSSMIEVVPVIWPCDNDAGVLKDYFDDQMAADASGFAFARALAKFRQRQVRAIDNPGDVPECLKRINVLAHSMGNRVLRESFRIWCSDMLRNDPPLMFRNTFLMAADVVNETLETRDGRYITNASRNTVVYFASDDLALRSSKVANAAQVSRRLGHTGPENLARVARNVVAVDCDEVNTDYDFPKGHSYFLDDDDGGAGVVFRHMLKCVETGRVPQPAPAPLQYAR